jgi:hypothetical protein
VRILRLVVLGVALAALPSCGEAPPPKVVKHEAAPSWQDVFDGTPELYAVVRPQLMKRDAVYGNFFKVVMRIAQARAEAAGATVLEAAEGCDEILVGISRREGMPEEAAIVFRGVPANLDPQKMTDSAGHPMFRLVDSHAKVPELERLDRRNVAGGSLFVLPDRTWVVALGDARARARQAFASPFGRPAPKVDPNALASVRLDANAFLKNGRFGTSPLTAPLVKKLTAAIVGLMPGQGGVVVRLQYQDEDATAWAEMQAKRVLDEVAHAEPQQAPPPRPPAAGGHRRPTTAPPPPPPDAGPRLAWLKDAKVTRDGNAIDVHLPVPPRLLEDLPNVTGGDIPF